MNILFHIFSKKTFAYVLLLTIACIIPGCFCSKQKKPTYVVVRNIFWESIDLKGTQKSVQGFTDDLMYDIAQQEKFRVQIISTEVTPIVSALNNPQVDGVLSAYPPTPDNERYLLFSDPYFVVGPVLVIRKGSGFTSLNDMNGKEVAFERGFPYAIQLSETANCYFRPYDKVNAAIEDLLNKSVDGVIIDSTIAFQLVQGLYAGKIQIAGTPLKPTALRLITIKGENDELIDVFNTGLKTFYADGKLEELLHYWNLYDAQHLSFQEIKK